MVDSGWTGGFLDEEAYQWVRDVSLLTDEECTPPYAVGLDHNTASSPPRPAWPPARPPRTTFVRRRSTRRSPAPG